MMAGSASEDGAPATPSSGGWTGSRAGQPLVWRLVLAVLVPVAVLAVLVVGTVSVYYGWILSHPPRQAVVGTPASGASLEYRCLPYVSPAVVCSDQSLWSQEPGVRLTGWIMPATGNDYPGSSGNWSQSTVVFVFDQGQSSTSSDFPVWSVARMLVYQFGYNVVLFNTRGTGDASGSGIGFGTLETQDLLAVINQIQTSGPPQGHIAVWGFGTGADAALLAAARSPHISAVIADSPYLTPNQYVRRLVPLRTPLPAFPFARTVNWALQREMGSDFDAYNALAAVSKLGQPVARPLLLVAGRDDALTPAADIRSLFSASHDSKAYTLIVSGAGHLQSFAQSPPSSDDPAVSDYMCHVLNTLAAMRDADGDPAQSPAGPCGGATTSPSPGA